MTACMCLVEAIAGARFMAYQKTKQGLEMTFALNHLAYFLLTLVLDVLGQHSRANHQHFIRVSTRGSILKIFRNGISTTVGRPMPSQSSPTCSLPQNSPVASTVPG